MTSILFVFTRPPHGSINAQEGLDALLMGSAFANCSALFLGDAVLQLMRHQDPEPLGFKDFARGFSALPDYGVTRIVCDQTALKRFGLQAEDLLLPVDSASETEIVELLDTHDKVLNF